MAADTIMVAATLNRLSRSQVGDPEKFGKDVFGFTHVRHLYSHVLELDTLTVFKKDRVIGKKVAEAAYAAERTYI